MITVFDSGVGGLSVLKELIALAPSEEYLYFSDNAHCPYGEKSVEYIRERASQITETAIEHGAEIIVVACNTATAAAIRYLREKYPIPFVGMEPAVKPAALNSESKVIGVLATSGTLKGELFKNTSQKYGKGVKIISRIGKGLVELVEQGKTEGPEAEKQISECIEPMIEAGADQIVLGCTHYPFLEETIKKCAPGVNILNPAPAVARHTIEVIREKIRPLKAAGTGIVTLMSSGNPERLYAMADKHLKGIEIRES